MYLMDPEGRFCNFFGKNFTAEEATKRMVADIETYQRKQQAAAGKSGAPKA